METLTINKLQTYITSEYKDAILYKEMAKKAPNEQFKNLLLEFSKDEQSHADEFNIVHKMILGKKYIPNIAIPKADGSFYKILMSRVFDEINDFRKYSKEYMAENENKTLKNTYYKASIDENTHALKLLYMLSDKSFDKNINL